MYGSDYGYAASPIYWTYKGYDTATTDYRAAVNENWLYMGIYEWTISRRSDTSGRAFTIDLTGVVSYGNVFNGLSAVRPCFYLSTNVLYNSGNGEKSSPITID